MSMEIILVLAILIAVMVFLITEWIPLEALAFLVLGVLAVTGIVSPPEALAGFSNPAVVTIWAVFILSGGLTRTGIANILGRQLLKVAGNREAILVLIIMVIAGGLSAFMNNVAIAALMLPVVMDIARKTNRSPAALLMPLAYGSLLGGLTTMIGTPPNILVSEALRDNGLKAFGLFDYTPVGLIVMASGCLFVAFIGTRFLPRRHPVKETTGNHVDYKDLYALEERLFSIRIPEDSPLVGRALADSRLGAAFRLNVIGISRGKQTRMAPAASEIIRAQDQLIVEGRHDQIEELNHWGHLLTETEPIRTDALFHYGMQVAEATLADGMGTAGRTLAELAFRNRFGLNVLAIQSGGQRYTEGLKSRKLRAGNRLIVHGPAEKIAALEENSDFAEVRRLDSDGVDEDLLLENHLHMLQVPEQSRLIGQTVSESRLGDAVDVQILCILRENGEAHVPESNDSFRPGDRLIVTGAEDMLSILLMRGLEGLFVEGSPVSDKTLLEDKEIGLVEVTLSPHSTLSGQTMAEINFREKFGLSVLAVWRQGKAYRSGLRDLALEFGDALLVYGPWQKLNVLGKETDFLVLTENAQEVSREDKAPLALAIMAAVLLPVIFGWLPIYIAVVLGAAFMILSRCLTMEEAYRYIEWKAVFLIAGMLPLGTALDKTGAARLLAEGVVGALGPFGPRAVLFGLLAITFAATSIIPTAALVVLMVPIALETAGGLGISPYALMMGIAMAASSSFTSPISHPANILVMGPGGYRFADYMKVGIPLTLVVLAVLMIFLPVFWPLLP